MRENDGRVSNVRWGDRGLLSDFVDADLRVWVAEEDVDDGFRPISSVAQ